MSAEVSVRVRRGLDPASMGSVEPATIYIVEDDADLRDTLIWTLQGTGLRPMSCDSGASALQTILPDVCGCVLIDLNLPDMNGLELHKRLLDKGCRQPFLVLTGCRDVALAVQSLQDGAVDFLLKPFSRERLLARVRQAVEHDREQHVFRRRIDTLTERERDILKLLAEGRATKEIANFFGISPRTVDVHRHHVLKKMGAPTLVQLVRQLNGRSVH